MVPGKTRQHSVLTSWTRMLYSLRSPCTNRQSWYSVRMISSISLYAPRSRACLQTATPYQVNIPSGLSCVGPSMIDLTDRVEVSRPSLPFHMSVESSCFRFGHAKARHEQVPPDKFLCWTTEVEM